MDTFEEHGSPRDLHIVNEELERMGATEGVEPIVKDVETDEQARQRQENLNLRIPGSHFEVAQKLLHNGRTTLTHFIEHKLEAIDIDDGEGVKQYSEYAATLKEFDSPLFERLYREPAGISRDFREALYVICDSPLGFLRHAYNVKIFSPDLYEELAPTLKKMWPKIAAEMKEITTKEAWGYFAHNYAMASFLDYSEIAGQIRIEDHWPEIVDYVHGNDERGLYYAEVVADCQVIAPVGKSVRYTEKDWQRALLSLQGDVAKYQNGKGKDDQDLMFFLESARGVKYLKVT